MSEKTKPAERPWREMQRISADVRWLKFTPEQRAQQMRDLARQRWAGHVPKRKR